MLRYRTISSPKLPSAGSDPPLSTLIDETCVICVALPFLPAGAEGYPLMARLLRPKVFGAILLLALVSNLLFGYYMAKIFFTS